MENGLEDLSLRHAGAPRFGLEALIGAVRVRAPDRPANHRPCRGLEPRIRAANAGLLAAVRGHWQAIEDGPHHQRDVTFREDACRVAYRGAAQVLATLRNLALGLYNLAADRGATEAPSAAAQCRRMTFGVACRWLRGGVHA